MSISRWYNLTTCQVTNQQNVEGEWGEFFDLKKLTAAWKKFKAKHPEINPLQWQVECWRRDEKGKLYGGYDDCHKLLDLPSLKPLSNPTLKKRTVVVMASRYVALQLKALDKGVTKQEQEEANALLKGLRKMRVDLTRIKVKR